MNVAIETKHLLIISVPWSGKMPKTQKKSGKHEKVILKRQWHALHYRKQERNNFEIHFLFATLPFKVYRKAGHFRI